jgi:hypothetical protein
MQAEVFPLIRAGGVFLTIAGASIMAGALHYRARYAIFGVGAAIASVATALLAPRLAASFGPPSAAAIASLVIAVALEVVLLIPVLRTAGRRDDHDTTLAILTIVGGHFLLMAPAFGPLIVALAVLSVANTLAGLLSRWYPSQALWAVDGALKAGAGAMMFMGDRIVCYACTH